MSRRSFLFLQTIASPFFRRLGDGLARRGHRVGKISYCQGDALYWRGSDVLAFRGRVDELPDFYTRVYDDRQVSDIVLFGDCRPIHRPAMALARERGMRSWVFEEGYLRPGWITLEEGGVNGNSALMRNADFFRAQASSLPAVPTAEPVRAGLGWRVAYDIAYNVANYLPPYRYPGYRTHRPYPIWREYRSWISRLVRQPWENASARRATEALLRDALPYYLLPLQLDSDVQIRIHSPFRNVPAAIEAVIASFAAHAHDEAGLVIKNHPLDNGMISYRGLIANYARAHGVASRVKFLDGGDLNKLMDHALGVVVVNSTVGLSALQRGRPVIALGKALYDLDGLTERRGLDCFWQDPIPPDMALLDAFLRVLVHHTQINGNYYMLEDIAVGVENAISRMIRTPEGKEVGLHLAGGCSSLREAVPRYCSDNRDNSFA